MTYSAVIDGVFRYELEYRLSESGTIVSVIMVNPSKADGIIKDSTIRKLDGFGKRLNWAKYIVGNVHAFIATDVDELKTAIDPVGPMNETHLLTIMLKTEMTIVAWGTLSKLPPGLRNNWRNVVKIADLLNRPLYCFGVCNDGHPKHPLMIGYNSSLEKWSVPT